jgi:FMN-dependent oxidoreductase (nitrilotriacetate monooxygenase family)
MKQQQVRQMRLGVFVMTAGHHVAAWRMPESHTGASFAEFKQVAKTAEAAKFDMLFLADTLSVRLGDREATRRNAHNFGTTLLEPLTLLSALSTVTERIGLVATASTTFTEPYNLARLFASLDHLSNGRAAWNIVTTADPESARNFGLDQVLGHDERYVRAEEYVDVVRMLWDSWDDGAIVRDGLRGEFIDLDRQRFFGHQGKYLKVGGPLNIPRPPQGHPVLVQAGASGPGRDLAARVADVIFTVGATEEDAVAFYKDVKARAPKHGRRPEDILIMPGVNPVVGSTEAEARAKLQRLHEQIDPQSALSSLQNFMPDIDLRSFPLDAPVTDLPVTQAQQSRQQVALELARRENLTLRQLALRFAGTRGHWTVVGDPVQVADQLERRFLVGGADGFNLMPYLFPTALEDFTQHVVPELQRRGLFRKDYEGSTLRDHLGLSQPACGK